MAKLKVQLHVHSKEDPIDNIKLTARQLIDLAAKLNYDVLAITCHNVVIFNEELKNYAEEKRILLIPAIEKTIQKKHVLIINADIDAQKIRTFEELNEYKLKKKNCLVIAAHPYFPSWTSLGKQFNLQHELFDAVEYCWFHSKNLNWFNKRAIKAAEKYKLPVIGASDCHIQKYFDFTYSFIESEKNLHSIIQAIKANKIHIISHDLPFWKLPLIFTKMMLLELLKKIMLK